MTEPSTLVAAVDHQLTGSSARPAVDLNNLDWKTGLATRSLHTLSVTW